MNDEDDGHVVFARDGNSWTIRFPGLSYFYWYDWGRRVWCVIDCESGEQESEGDEA